MKRSIAALCIVACLLPVILTGCTKKAVLENVLEEYSKIVAGDFPDDIRLTIYYEPLHVLTRFPWDKEFLMSVCETKITVEGEDLAPYWEMMKELDASELEPVQEESYRNARICYFLEVGSSGKVLEVVIHQEPGNIDVNGIEVEQHPWFYELIVDFLEAEGCELPNFR